MKALRLGVNVDHVATVRNARGGALPDPVLAAMAAIDAGCDGITAHLREDRRHIRDEDIARLTSTITVPLNLEMAVTPAMTEIALRTAPHAACLVPEKREERTTEGGLDVVGGFDTVAPVARRLVAAGIRVSLFIEPARAALEAARDMGAPVVEFHTGHWCELVAEGRKEEAAEAFARIREAARIGTDFGIECHAGHGLDYDTAEIIAAVPEIVELNIGHFLIGDAILVGLPVAIARMRQAMARGRAQASHA